jgi:hypothetical protein
MVSSGMLRRVAHVRTDVSEEPSVSFIRVTRISELGTTLAATSSRRTLRRNLRSVRRLLDFHGGDYEEWVSSGMLRRVALVRTNVSEEPSSSFIRVTESVN